MTFLNLFKRISTLNQPVLENPKVEGNNLTYRERLAETIAGLEKYGETGKALADVFLMREKFTEDYLSTMGKDEKFGREECMKFLKEGKVELIFKYREHFEGISDEDFLNLLLGRGNYRIDEFLENFDKFKGLNYEDTLLKIHEKHGDYRIMEEFIRKGRGFTVKTLKMLSNCNRGDLVIDNLDKFEGLTHLQIFDILVDTCSYYTLLDNLDKIQGENYQELIYKIIDNDGGSALIEYLDKIKGVSHQELLYKLLDTNQGETAISNLEKFKGIDYHRLVDKLIEKGLGVLILKYKNKLQGVDLSEKMNEIIKQLELLEIEDKLLFLQFIPGKYHKDIISKIDIKKRFSLSNLWYNSLDDLKCKLPAEMVEKLLDEGYIMKADDVIKCINKSENLNPRIAEKFIKKGYHDVVLQNPEKFGLKKEK